MNKTFTMNKRLSLFAAAIAALLVSLNPAANAQTNAGVSAVLDPVTGSTLIIGSTFPVTAQVFNNGTTTITTMQIKFNIGINNTNTALDEIWTGTLAPGDTMSYTFTALFTLNDTSNSSTFCLADAPGDTDPFNNSAYPVYNFAGVATVSEAAGLDEEITIDHLIVVPGHALKLGLTTAGDNGDVEVFILSLGGRRIISQTTVEMSTGGEILLNLSYLPHGLYIVVVRNNQGVAVRKFII